MGVMFALFFRMKNTAQCVLFWDSMTGTIGYYFSEVKVSFSNIHVFRCRPVTMSALSTSFNEDQMAEFQEAFLLFDNHGDGRIPVRPNTKHIPW